MIFVTPSLNMGFGDNIFIFQKVYLENKIFQLIISYGTSKTMNNA